MKSSRYPHLSTIELKNLLRRRKVTFEDWLNQNGIFTYELLLERCDRMGVVPPSQEDFLEVMPKKVISSPTEGVVILPLPPMVRESTGEIIEDQIPNEEEQPPERSSSERKKRR